MKKILLGALVLGSSMAIAQNAKPASSYSSNASSLVMAFNGKKLLDAKVYGEAGLKMMEAKKTSGETVKGKVESKIYTYYGLTCFALSNQTEGEESAKYLSLSKDLLIKEVEFEQAGTNFEKAKGRLTMIANKMYNASRDKYSAQDYAGALKGSMEAVALKEKLGEKFLQGYYIAALSSSFLEKYSESIKYMDVLLATDFADEKNGPFLYSKKAFAERALGKSEESLKTIKKGIKAFPGNKDLYTAEADYYLQTGQTEKAFETINGLIEQDPNNPLFHALICDLHGTLANNEKSDEKWKAEMLKGIEAYMKSTEADPQYYYAYYNAGASLITISNKILNARNALTLEETKNKGAAMKEEEDKYYKDATKMFTTCTVIKPNEIEAYEALRKIYFQIDDLEKSSEMKKKIAEIKAAQ